MKRRRHAGAFRKNLKKRSHLGLLSLLQPGGHAPWIRLLGDRLSVFNPILKHILRTKTDRLDEQVLWIVCTYRGAKLSPIWLMSFDGDSLFGRQHTL